MRITKDVYEKIQSKYVMPPPEQGGIIGIKNGVVCEYYHDSFCGFTDKAIYEPAVDILNQKIEEWLENDIQFAGIVHSHVLGQDALSSGDINYIKVLFDNFPEWIDELYFPVIIPEAKQLISFIAKKEKKDVIIHRDEIHINL